jgi:CBS domain-containing protein
MPDAVIQPSHGSYLMPSLEHATVGDAMHPGILSCSADAPLTDVARMMAANHVHCIAVMGIAHDHSGESLVWGIISDLDLMRAGIRVGDSESAGALAHQSIISVEPSMSLREAGGLMLTHQVSHLVVIEPKTLLPIGILSSLDLAGVLAWGEA